MPIVYKFRHVADNTLAQVSLTSQYTIVRPLQLRQRVEVVLDKLACESASDVEGGIDVYGLSVWLNAWETVGGTEVQVGDADQTIYAWPGGETEMYAGTELQAGQSKVFTFDTVAGDYAMARIEVRGYAIENDVWPNEDEEGWGYLPVSSGQFAFGQTKIMRIIAPGDFVIQAHVRFLDATQ